VLDSNSDPDGIAYPIPGNDDALRAIDLYCDMISRAVLAGLQQEAIAAGVDVGESEETPGEALADGEAGEAEAVPPPAAEAAEEQPAATH